MDDQGLARSTQLAQAVGCRPTDDWPPDGNHTGLHPPPADAGSFAAAATKSAIARFEYIDFLAESVNRFRARFVSFRARFERFRAGSGRFRARRVSLLDSADYAQDAADFINFHARNAHKMPALADQRLASRH